MKQGNLFQNVNTPINATYFLSLLGIDPDELKNNALVRGAVRTDVQTGGLHGLSYLAKKNRQNGYSIKVHHWVRHPDGKDHKAKILHLKSVQNKPDEYTLDHAMLFGSKVDFQNETEFFHFLSRLKDILKVIRHHHLPSLKTIVDLRSSVQRRGKGTLEGMDASGDPVFQPLAPDETSRAFRVPSKILPALLGYHSDTPTAQKPVIIKIASGSEIETFQPFFSQAKFEYTDKGGVDVVVQAWKNNASSSQLRQSAPVKWFHLKFDPDKKDPDTMKLSYAYCCGKRVKVTDALNISRLCRATASAVHQIRSKETIPSLQQIIQDNGLHDVVNHNIQKMNKTIPEKGQMLMNILGGNNIQDSRFDKGRIGANAYLYSYQKSSQHQPEGILVDWGVLFMNREKDGYDGSMVNPEGILQHRDPGHKQPETRIRALVITHAHEDHVGAIPHIIKAGYLIPKIVCSAISRSFIEEKIRTLGISKDKWPEFKTVEPYQRFQVGAFRMRALPMSHSLPCLGYRIGTSAGSVFHTGDFKMDQTVKAGYPTDKKALAKLHVDAVVSDSTSVKREGEAVLEQEIEDNFFDLFEENLDNRFVVSLLGSNLNRMMSILHAAARSGKTIIITGHALDVSRRILNTTGFKDPLTGKHYTLKDYFREKYNCEIFTSNSQKAKDLLAKGSADTVILATGTHNEKLSTMDKVLGWFHNDIELYPHRDVIVPSQGLIPGGEEGYNAIIKRAEEQGYDVLHAGNPKAKGRVFFESGHAKRVDQERFIQTVSCDNFIPVHGDMDQITANAALIRENGKHAILGNNQNVINIIRGQRPFVIGNRPEDIVYYKHQRADDVYFGGSVSYNIDRADPILSGKQALLSNIPALTVNTEHHQEENYRAQSDVLYKVRIENHQLSQRMAQSWKVNYDRLIFHDIETTDKGLGEIVQHASIMTDNRGNVLRETNLLKRINKTILPSPMACLITNTSPYDMLAEGRLPPEAFSKEMYELFAQEKKAERILAVTHNGLAFDNPKIAEDLHKRGFGRTAVANTKGVRSADTLLMSRAAYTYVPGALQTIKIDNRPSFKLTDLMMANGLTSDVSGAHDGLYDAALTHKLTNHLLTNAHDVTQEMLLRTDKNATKDLLLGTGKGMQYRPIMTYVRNTAQGPEAKMGMLMNLDLKRSYGNKAFMFNLAYNPKDLDQMTSYQVMKLLSDPKQDVLTVFALNKQPIILPAQYGFEINAHKDMNLRVMEQRQQDVLRNPERSRVISEGGTMYLSRGGKEQSAYFVEDYLYPQMGGYYEKNAYRRDRKLMEAIEPTVKELTAEKIAEILPKLAHPASVTVTENRLYDLDPDLLSDERREVIEAKRRMAYQAPANSPMMGFKRHQMEIQQILDNKDVWIGDDPRKQQILEDVIRHGKEMEAAYGLQHMDHVKAGIAIHNRLRV